VLEVKWPGDVVVASIHWGSNCGYGVLRRTALCAPGRAGPRTVDCARPLARRGLGVRHLRRRALKPHTDYREWKRLLKLAGLREARLHDARHTAATVLLILGVPARTVMSLMGWSSAEMAARYQHVTDTIRQDVARQVDSLIWRVRGGVDTADAEGPGEVDGAARDPVVPVDPSWLATILDLAELGLAHADQPTVASARPVVEQVRSLLAGGAHEPGSDGAHTPEGETN
jgi:hypothetical protein